MDSLTAFAFALPIAVPCLGWALGAGRARRRWLWLAAGVLSLVSLGPASLGGYVFPPWRDIPVAMFRTSAYYFVLLLTILGNVLFLERLGLRIRKTGTRAGAAGVTP